MTSEVERLQARVAELERQLAWSDGRRGDAVQKAAGFTSVETQILRMLAARGFIAYDSMESLQRHISNIRAKLPESVVIRTDTNTGYEVILGREELSRICAGDQMPSAIDRVQADLLILQERFPRGVSAVQLAFRYDLKVAQAQVILSALERKGAGEFAALGRESVFVINVKQWKGGVGTDSSDHSLSRFGAHKVEPEKAIDLRADHPAIIEGRTIFPTTVTPVRESERLLVSGHNNPKLGAEVRKGPWAGMPLYHLTLEERATCPRSCALWAGCYGNAMHMSRRHDHRDPQFLTYLENELLALAGQHPFGFVIRLHTLGDFFSTGYVAFWAAMLDKIPPLRAFGYTANSSFAEDETEAAIGEAIETLAFERWERFAIRLSGTRGPAGASVVNEPDPDLLMCPAQTGDTAACSTCGLCWAPAAFERTIGFLRHGMKRRA